SVACVRMRCARSALASSASGLSQSVIEIARELSALVRKNASAKPSTCSSSSVTDSNPARSRSTSPVYLLTRANISPLSVIGGLGGHQGPANAAWRRGRARAAVAGRRGDRDVVRSRLELGRRRAGRLERRACGRQRLVELRALPLRDLAAARSRCAYDRLQHV